MHISYFGAPNTYTYHVTQQTFPEAQLHACTFAPDVLSAIALEKTDFGVLPFENLYNGKVMFSIDALLHEGGSRVQIIDELILPIRHCVGGVSQPIFEIRSQQQALEQCIHWIRATYPEVRIATALNTAIAAREIGIQGLEGIAAIASEEALLDAGLKVYHRDILPNNMTRFALLQRREESTPPVGDASSIRTALGIYLARDAPGALHAITGPLAQAEINMFQIDSRPNGQKGYCFFTEVAGSCYTRPLSTVLGAIRDRLKTSGSELKVLGCYQSNGWTL